jgi:hypothetical protein
LKGNDFTVNELERLKAMLDAEQVKLGVSLRRMNSPGSPVYHTWENVWPTATILIASFVTLKWGGPPLEALGIPQGGTWAGMAVLGLGCWWWLTKIMPKIKEGVFDRTAALALSSPQQFDLLWSKSILSLYAKLPDGTEWAAARRDDWRAFVRKLHDALSKEEQ